MYQKKRAYHIPHGDPCCKCGLPASAHVVEHRPQGDPCRRCGLPASQHRVRKRPDKRKTREKLFVGIDGEGVGRKNHRYMMLCWAPETGPGKSLEALPGSRLRTAQCLDFILGIPARAKIYAFAFSYDLTHILKDLPNALLYKLLRPELRPPPPGTPPHKRKPAPIKWRGYTLNIISRKFTVQKGRQRRVIWDVFAFYGCKFTAALKTWKAGDPEVIKEIERLKVQRSDFDKLTRNEVRDYCLSECAMLAALVRKLVQAHNTAGLPLKTFYGAGSSASAALKKWKIDKEVRAGPDEVEQCAAHAFFGGRFEISKAGKIEGPVYGYDISSAYPYQCAFLPELENGTWTHVYDEEQAKNSTTALIRYSLPRQKSKDWGPLPFRTSDGGIAFPRASGGGWVWQSEYFAAKQLWKPRFHEAWVYNTDDDRKPFAQMPEIYRRRLELGKEGPGMVLKLAANSVYGKTAQSVGEAPPFQSWVWAGMITAGCRAQLLELMALHKDLSNVVMVATDGLYSTERITPPAPIDTGTHTEHKKPLGGWEIKEVPSGLFSARPGIYFPLERAEVEDDDGEDIRARGVGRENMLTHWQLAIQAFEARKPEVKLANVVRFNGAKNTIHKSGKGYKRSPLYGQWTPKEIRLSFDPMPKRGRMLKDGRLTLREFIGEESAPYNPAIRPTEVVAAVAEREELEEQPDFDFAAHY